MILDEWKAKNKYSRKYAHFDNRIKLDDVWDYIDNPRKIESHSFYPFIHYTLIFDKYNKEKGVKLKKRELCYSAHIDRLIFSYYGFKLNHLYNLRVAEDKLNDCAIAYRDNMGKCNIHYAKQAIDFIRDTKECYIIVGDFTSFFDSLEHQYLKKMLCNLLKVEKLSADYYAVFKNITKYSKWDMESLLELNNLPFKENGIRSLNKLEQVISLLQFRKFKNKYWTKKDAEGKETNEKYVIKNPDPYGIPQGSAISAVLSNIYILDFDKCINEYVKDFNGLYMRYCDDFIIVLPKADETIFKEQFHYIKEVINSTPKIDMQPDKTQIFVYNEGTLLSYNELVLEGIKNQRNLLNYLGFTFDGNVVTIRDKTISKYYYRMYRKLKTITKNNGITAGGKKISCKKLYKTYTVKGAFVDNSNKGNFLTYVNKAKRIWGSNEAIDRSTKNHLQKIRKRLNTIKDV